MDERHERLLAAGAPEPALVYDKAFIADRDDIAKYAFSFLSSPRTVMSLLLEVARPHGEVEVHLVADVGAEIRPEETEIAAPPGA